MFDTCHGLLGHIYQTCLKMCEENQIDISEIKRRKVSTKFNSFGNNQHFFHKKN